MAPERTCGGCGGDVPNPEYVVTVKVTTRKEPDIYPIHDDDCMGRWFDKEIGTSACPLKSPHCSLATA